MWSQYYQTNIAKLLRESILSLCSENIPYQDKLEVDGIICISFGAETHDIVIKLHEVLSTLERVPGKCSPNFAHQGTPEGILVSTGHDETFLPFEKDGRPDNNICVEKGNIDIVPIPVLEQDQFDLDSKHEPWSNKDERQGVKEIVKTQGMPHELNPVNFREDKYNCEESEVECHVETIRKKFSCRICSNSFNSFSSLSVHMTSSHGRFPCKFCLNSFSMLCNLKRHERLHAGRKPYTCTSCGRGFSRNSDLRLHESKRHSHNKTTAEKFQGKISKDVQSRKSKSSNLSAILTKLTKKQMLNIKAEEKKAKRKKRPSLAEVTNDVTINLSHAHNSSTNKNVDIDITPSSSSDIVDGELSSNGESGNYCVPVPTPLFTRSILKPAKEKSPDILSDHPRIIHIVPNNNTSGGYMEEQVDISAKYRPSLSPVRLQDSGLDTIHGLSFGRIVFPGQNTSLANENQDQLSTKPVSVYQVNLSRTKDLPFHSYLRSGQEAVQKINSGDDLIDLTTETTNRANSPLYGSSRSSSPVGSVRDDLMDIAPSISQDRQYKCQICMSLWENFKAYEEHHIQDHSRYPCHFCDQTFSNKNNRSRHIRSHTGQREHTCLECGKCFSRSDTLKEHQIIHTDGYIGDKCSFCNVVIKKKAELLSHIKKCSLKNKFSDAASPSAGLE